jgi:PhzF family phenazine biosynthesis protein
MKLNLYQVDAFTSKLFGGNPAAVIPLQQWMDTALMQQIALENNLSETVFFVAAHGTQADYEIRWFTPEVEINLCGHATLASAFVLFEILNFTKEELVFSSKSGLLKISNQSQNAATGGFMARMDFPSWKPERLNDYPDVLNEVLGLDEIVGIYQNRDMLVELQNEDAVKNCNPDFTLMKKHFDKMIITAPGKSVDFVSRFFAPGAGVNEDPVTGSAHAQLIPFWSEKLHKKKMHALQLSKRGGEIWCEQLNDERVAIAGNCVFYMKGEISL